MFKRLAFPWAYVLEPLLAVPSLLSFYCVFAFVASSPADAVRASGVDIPAHWEAAVANHGEYLRGFLPSAHPWWFGAAVASLVVWGLIAWQLKLAQASQQLAAAPEHAWRHKVARTVALLAWVLVGWLLFSFGLSYLAAV